VAIAGVDAARGAPRGQIAGRRTGYNPRRYGQASHTREPSDHLRSQGRPILSTERNGPRFVGPLPIWAVPHKEDGKLLIDREINDNRLHPRTANS
jgi:hypothetical protein